MIEPTLVWNEQAQLGEGPIWVKDRLYWIDIIGRRLHAWTPLTRSRQTWQLANTPGTVVPRARGGLLIADDQGFTCFDPETGTQSHLATPPGFSKTGRMNDGKCDPAGRFWGGTMPLEWGEDSGLLYRLDASHKSDVMLTGIQCSNGIAWSGDKSRMFYIDTPTRCIDAFDYDHESGSISNRRTVVHIKDGKGMPDGMAIDSEDRLWVGMWDGSSVRCYDPDKGKEIERIEVPALNVTACAFGGQHLDELYITTARVECDVDDLERFPECGSLFMCKPGVRGVDAHAFAG